MPDERQGWVVDADEGRAQGSSSPRPTNDCEVRGGGTKVPVVAVVL